MKTIQSIFVFAAILLMASCKINTQSYTINGFLADSTMNGKYVYLQAYEKNDALDSALVESEIIHNFF